MLEYVSLVFTIFYLFIYLFIFFEAFERHHIDRNFGRTGQTVIIVAPGSGVFEVDREMTSITKQRLLDSGTLKLQIFPISRK